MASTIALSTAKNSNLMASRLRVIWHLVQNAKLKRALGLGCAHCLTYIDIIKESMVIMRSPAILLYCGQIIHYDKTFTCAALMISLITRIATPDA